MLRKSLSIVGAVVIFLNAISCHHESSEKRDSPAIVGAWIVKIPEAPFPMHMFVFHADGTVVQSNPDVGDANSSDSNLMGVWVRDGEGFEGKVVEVTADRATHKFLSRVEISYALKFSGDTFNGAARAVSFDAEGRQLKEPIRTTMAGQRVLP